MVSLGEIVECTVTEVGSYGLYASTSGGEIVFVNFAELSWFRIRESNDAVSLGETVKVKIMDEPTLNRSYFLGSLKRAVPELDPWQNPLINAGAVLDTKLVRIGTDVAFFELPNEIIVGVAVTGSQKKEMRVGDTIRLKLTEVSRESRNISAIIETGKK